MLYFAHTALCTLSECRKSLLSALVQLNCGIRQLQNKFFSCYIVHWFTGEFPSLYAFGFMVFFAFSLVQTIAPQSLYALSPLGSTIMGGADYPQRLAALQVAEYGANSLNSWSRPYAYSAASGAVYGWPSQDQALSASQEADSFVGESPIIIYEVKQGDTAVSVAEHFRISIDTLVQANNLSLTEFSPGQRLIILPVSGALYEIQAGDTLESVSQNFNVPLDRIEAMNGFDFKVVLSPGEKIIVPGATAKTKLAFSQSLVSGAQFRMPTVGWNCGALHRVNAVDIANRCGTPVYASANGTVTETQDTGWNNGYGIFILIKHAESTQTRYAHLSSVFVASGAAVKQGQLIGAIGKSGKVDGVSGCHLHFEVLGAANPFAR